MFSGATWKYLYFQAIVTLSVEGTSTEQGSATSSLVTQE